MLRSSSYTHTEDLPMTELNTNEAAWEQAEAAYLGIVRSSAEMGMTRRSEGSSPKASSRAEARRSSSRG